MISTVIPVLFAAVAAQLPSEDFPPFQMSYDTLADIMAQERNGGSLRDSEYLPQNSVWGHKYMQGGAGEGKQYLSPEGFFENREEVKTDAMLPAYCEPPNPCPPGYTGDDGCLEDFENTADFSRDYQAKQDCMCDEEHMFNCPRKQPEMSAGMDQFDMSPLEQFMEEAAENPYYNGEKLPYIVAKKG